MRPFVVSGDLVITCRYGGVAIDDVVVMALPGYGRVVKRVRQVTENSLVLASDNREIFSSVCGLRQSKAHLIGKVLFKLNLKPQRAV